MKRNMRQLGLVLLFVAGSAAGFAQSKTEKGPWRRVNESSIPATGTRYIIPTSYLTFRLDVDQMRQTLSQAKRIDDPNYIPVFIDLPKPDGSSSTYQVQLNETMAPGLMEQFPEIRTYDGIATDNSGEVVKLDLTPQGFHAMTLIPGKPTLFIDPYSHLGDGLHYIVYSRTDYVVNKEFACHLETEIPTDVIDKEMDPVKVLGNCTKRTYRLALNATGEYTAFHGGTVVLAQAAQVTTMNRVNGVYMRDVAVTMTIIANNNLLIYTNASTDPFTNGNPGSMITQSQNNCNTVIGSANYDIGHVFGTNSGGLAGLGVVCVNGSKGRGVTGSSAPIGDPFDIDYVAHEIGHQFAGNHTFSGNNGSCNGNGNNGTAVEPGSGSSIMAYAGICAPSNIQPNSDDHFVFRSMQEIHTFLAGTGNGCAVSTAIPNQSAPTITVAGGSYSIPISTPFALTASATDPDGDVLTYCWEQNNAASGVNVPTATQTTGPNFRSRTPSTNPTRYFPAISALTGGTSTYEVLPSVARTMSFKCLVRDNEVGGGCNDEETVSITTVASAGPFVVNQPNATGISWPGNSTQTVTWSVANTNVAPVSCANVDIYISTDGGASFTLVANDVPNDGTQDITVPNVATTQAIAMVMCENGTFFDVSNNVFTITASTNDYTLALVNNSISACQGTNAQFTVSVGQIGTYTSPVTLSTTGIPAPATVNFSPNPATPGTSVTMTVSNTAGVAPGNYNFTINGTSASGPQSTTGTLVISTAGVAASTLTLPVNAEPAAPIQTVLTWTNAGTGLVYDIEIALDNGFTSIAESATGLTAATYTATTLAAGTTYYWRVSTYNACSTPVLSTVFSFTTATCATFSSSTAVTISASGTPTVTSTITVPTTGTINDINVVDLTGTHSWINDLTITLTSPAGTVVTLFDQVCDDEDNFNVNFDDEAAAGALPCPPVGGGNFQPGNTLSALDGEAMNGTWTLTITDNANQDGGALATWGIEICFTPTTPCNNPDVPTLSGATSFCAGGSTNLTVSAGNLNDATNWQWYSGSCGGTNIGSGTAISINTPGTYYVRGEGGCVTASTCQTVTVTQTTVNNGATISGHTLTATQSGAQYQWVDCNNGFAPVGGATAQNFSPAADGSYAVIVTVNGCADTSACLTYSTIGIEESANFVSSVYPNPTTGMITVQLHTAVTSMTVTDVTGRIVRQFAEQAANSVSIDLNKEAKGVYFLNVYVNERVQTLRIVKE
jgi:subtilisin-like proprotein convertase family protein